MRDFVPLKAHGTARSTLRTASSAEKIFGIFLRAAEYEATSLSELHEDIVCSDKLWEGFGNIFLFCLNAIIIICAAGFLLASELAVGTRAKYLSCEQKLKSYEQRTTLFNNR